MVAIFARAITDELTGLVKQIDKAVKDNEKEKLASFLILLSSDPEADEPRLKELAKKHGIEHVPLTLFEDAEGPSEYKLSEDAEVTVILWRKKTIESVHPFGPGKLDEKAVKQILADTIKLLQKDSNKDAKKAG